MAAETRTERRRWYRWQGTPTDIARLAYRMEELLTAAGIDQTVTIKVHRKARGGTTQLAYDSAAEAADRLPSADLTKIDTLVLRNSDWLISGISVSVHFSKYGIDLEVEGSGDHHIKVRGIADDVAAAISRNGRSWSHQMWVFAVFAVVWAAALGGAQLTEGTLSTALGIAPAVVALVVLGMINGVFVRAYEIVPEGQRSRTERIRGPLLKFVGWALTLITGALLGVLVANWLD